MEVIFRTLSAQAADLKRQLVLFYHEHLCRYSYVLHKERVV